MTGLAQKSLGVSLAAMLACGLAPCAAFADDADAPDDQAPVEQVDPADEPGEDPAGPGAGEGPTPSEPDEPADPGEPQPTDPAQPAEPADPTQPTDPDPGGDETAETNLERAMRLIEALPYDPLDVTEDMRAQIEDAQAAYDACTPDEQEWMDDNNLVDRTKSQSYGRLLQCCAWALASLAPLDTTTTLQDGTYTGTVNSTCSMGKSRSTRKLVFNVVSVTVQDGHATMLIEHESTSPNLVYVNGVEYPNLNPDGKSRFRIPVDLNSTIYFMQMAKDATENTVAIPYEFTTAIDEEHATPDPPEPAQPGADDQGGGDKPDDKPQAGPGGTSNGDGTGGSSQPGAGSTRRSGTPSSRQSNAAALAAAAARRTSAPTAATASTATANADASDADALSAQPDSTAEAEEVAAEAELLEAAAEEAAGAGGAVFGVEAAMEEPADELGAPAAAGGFALLAGALAFGACWFLGEYRWRDRRSFMKRYVY